MNKISFFTGLFLIGAQFLFGQKYNYASYKKGSAEIKYRILYPEHFDKNKKYPMVFFLHGSGERGTNNEKQLVHGSSLFLNNIDSFPAIVVFPQCPPEQYWAKLIRTETTDGLEFSFLFGEEPTEIMNTALSLMDSLYELEYINKNKIYVGGLSMGGMGTFEILWRRPEIITAAFVICGGGDPEFAEHYNKNLSIWVFHGAKDDVVLPEYSKLLVNAMKDKVEEVKFSLYPNANHNSWDSAFAEKDLFPWLFSKTKIQ